MALSADAAMAGTLAGLVDHFMSAKLKRCDYKNLDCVMTWADGCTEAAGPRIPHSGLGSYITRDQRSSTVTSRSHQRRR